MNYLGTDVEQLSNYKLSFSMLGKQLRFYWEESATFFTECQKTSDRVGKSLWGENAPLMLRLGLLKRVFVLSEPQRFLHVKIGYPVGFGADDGF